MRVFASLIIFLVVVLNAACQASPIDAGIPVEVSTDPAATSLSTPLLTSPVEDIVTPDKINATMTKLPERVPPTMANTPVIGEVPAELLGSILQDLATKTGAAPEKIAVIQAQSVVWNDGSLGCPQPGVMYTQALVKGYWVLLELDDKKYDYRAADNGYFFLCDKGLLPSPPSGTPSS